MADLTFFLSNTARFGEMTLGFLSRLAYNSGFLCKFAAIEPTTPLPNAHQGGAFLYIYVMAYTKLPISITDQIALLKSRGLTFADEVYAAQVLEHISYSSA